MITMGSPEEVAAAGTRVPVHFRPFFFEGAAMGYLPRGYLSRGYSPGTAEQDLLAMHPGFRYLYYVGLGFWYGMRHPRRPSSLARLAPHLDPVYFPLCYDGFGFKVAFFDYTRRPSAMGLLERGPAEHRAALYQGFGRALFFVFMDDEEGFRDVQDRVPPGRRADLEFGRSLALAFTGVGRPLVIARHLASARDAEEKAARLMGVTWALAAREMNDAEYFRECVGRAPLATGELLTLLPALCREALDGAVDYIDWQARTRAGVTRAFDGCGSSVIAEVS